MKKKLMVLLVMMMFVLGTPVVSALTNAPESPDTAEIYYDAASGYFSCWGTDNGNPQLTRYARVIVEFE